MVYWVLSLCRKHFEALMQCYTFFCQQCATMQMEFDIVGAVSTVYDMTENKENKKIKFLKLSTPILTKAPSKLLSHKLSNSLPL